MTEYLSFGFFLFYMFYFRNYVLIFDIYVKEKKEKEREKMRKGYLFSAKVFFSWPDRDARSVASA